jgi:hypothetical protein
MDADLHSAPDLTRRLSALDQERATESSTREKVEEAAELAAVAVAEGLQIPRIADNEVVQIVKEYLAGLVENSPLSEIFARWINHHAPEREVVGLVVPDPSKLETAADTAVDNYNYDTSGLFYPDLDQAMQRFIAESPAMAAIDLTNQLRYMQEGGGPCQHCAQASSPQHDGEHNAHPGGGRGISGRGIIRLLENVAADVGEG